jgi:hypothetical protein
MNTVQIRHALTSWLQSQSKYHAGIFKGVFALNQAPWVYTLDYPFGLVLNTKALGHEGDHWFAIYGSKSDEPVEIFDTRGGQIWSDYINSVVSLLSPRTVICNSYPLQSPCSNVCGEYCIAFLYCRITGTHFDEFLSAFHSTDFLKNDSRVYDFVHARFDILRDVVPFTPECYK